MAASDVQRKLAAILSADVQGYSRLMGEDEAATIEALTASREVFSSYIEQYRGRVVNAPGDSILADFASVVDAVGCAVEIQRELAERNAELPDDRRMDFRIGINLGDVVVKNGAIYGDGVNIAARVESLAEGGGICISGSAYAQVRNKLKLEYEFLGKKEVKNIDEPVPVYRVLSVPGAAAHRVIRAKKKLAARWGKAALAVAVVLVVGVGGFLAWNYYQQRELQAALAAFEKEAALPLPDKPSIAVLAFKNMSGDPEQEYFSDGISENIITRLAGLSDMFVIARNSSFKYKGKQVDVRQVGRELGVRYVLEGSVQKAGERVRITAQLIDAATRAHLWAGSYDRVLKDIFAVQDEITRTIVARVEPDQAHRRECPHPQQDNPPRRTRRPRSLDGVRPPHGLLFHRSAGHSRSVSADFAANRHKPTADRPAEGVRTILAPLRPPALCSTDACARSPRSTDARPARA
ncbi:MAG: adenylate/guanylate cyclase domain-containing protein [SAR324 cluster bacterium]|nr:adenylate/guanylate cyclase domain-containing protein [SAR324 cluster bacterium]